MKTRTQTWRDRAALIALIPVAIVWLAWGVIMGPRAPREEDNQ